MQNTFDSCRKWITIQIKITSAGIALMVLTGGDIFPMVWLAGFVSADGIIEPAFSKLLRSSQWLLSISFLITGFSVPFILNVYSWFRSAVQTMSTARFLFMCGAAAGGWSFFLHIVLFDRIPHVTDEISHLFQAKILLAGMWFAPAPPCPQLFIQHHIYITTDGKWFSIYPPGHATLLAATALIGIKNLLSPLSFAISTASIGWLAHHFLRSWTARRLTLLFVLSPLNWLLGASFMSHFTFMAMFSMSLVFLTALFNTQSCLHKKFILGLLSGLFLGYSGLIRPQDLILATIMTGMIVIIVSPRSIPRILACSPWLMPGLLIPFIYQIVWNHFQYGTFLALGYAHGVQTINPMLKPHFGFSANFGLHEAFNNTAWTLLRTNKVLLGWPTSLLILPLAIIPGRLHKKTLAAVTAAGTIIGFYFFYFYFGMEYEARFYHLAVPALLYLVVRSFDRISSWIGKSRSGNRALWVVICATCWIHAFIYYAPLYLWPKYANGYEQATIDIHEAVIKAQIQNAVVLIPSSGDHNFRYSSGFMWNDPYLKERVIYTRDPGGFPACLAESFPDRTLYRYAPDSNKQDGQFIRIEIPSGE